MIKNIGYCGCVKPVGGCPVELTFNCITYDGCELEEIGITSGDKGNDILKLIEKAVTSNKLSAANIGGGVEIYKGVSDRLVYEFKTLLGKDGVIIEEGEKTVTFKVDEAFLTKWLDSNFELTPDMLQKTFNLDEFKVYFASYLQDIMNRPEVRKFFEDYLWGIFGSQEFQLKFIDFLKVIYNEDTWKSFYEDYLRMMFSRHGFKEFFVNYLQSVFNTSDFRDFLEGYLLLLFNRTPFKDWVKSIVEGLLKDLNKGLDEEGVKQILRNFIVTDEFCSAVRRCTPNTFYEDLRNLESKLYIKSLFDEFYGSKDLKPQMVEVIKEYLLKPEFKGVIKGMFDEFIGGVDFCEKIKSCKKDLPKDAYLNDVVYRGENRAVIQLDPSTFKLSYVDPAGDEAFEGRSIRFANSLEGRLLYDGVPVTTGQEVATFNLSRLSYRAKDQNAAYEEEVEIVLI